MNFEPALGGEIRKIRLAVIVSNDAANVALNCTESCAGVPLTSHTGRIYPSEALITNVGKQSKAMADQLTTVDKQRFGALLGKVSPQEMRALEKAIQIQLGIRI